MVAFLVRLCAKVMFFSVAISAVVLLLLFYFYSCVVLVLEVAFAVKFEVKLVALCDKFLFTSSLVYDELTLTFK